MYVFIDRGIEIKIRMDGVRKKKSQIDEIYWSTISYEQLIINLNDVLDRAVCLKSC